MMTGPLPTCRNCLYLDHSPGEGPGDYEFSCDGRDIVSYESVMVVNPDRHFCSSHIDKETGMKFVNWGDA